MTATPRTTEDGFRHRTGRTFYDNPIFLDQMTPEQRKFVRQEYRWQRDFKGLPAYAVRSAITRWLIYFGPGSRA